MEDFTEHDWVARSRHGDYPPKLILETVHQYPYPPVPPIPPDDLAKVKHSPPPWRDRCWNKGRLVCSKNWQKARISCECLPSQLIFTAKITDEQGIKYYGEASTAVSWASKHKYYISVVAWSNGVNDWYPLRETEGDPLESIYWRKDDELPSSTGYSLVATGFYPHGTVLASETEVVIDHSKGYYLWVMDDMANETFVGWENGAPKSYDNEAEAQAHTIKFTL